jgi:polyhydroxyalkanoate synthesis regulator phasin
VLDTLRRYMEAGRDALTPRKAQDLAQALVREGQARRDQASALTRQLLDWSRRSSDRFRETIRGEVRRQIARSGLATKDEVAALRRRIRDLERSGSSGSSKKAAVARKKTSRKRTAAKKTSARKRSTSARSSAATRSPTGGGSSSG